MEWSDEGIILGTRRHGESNAIVELLTPGHGRHLGLVRGGAGKSRRSELQTGNSVAAHWRARLDEHLGNYTLEVTQARAAPLMASRIASYAMQTLAGLTRLLPERDPHPGLYAAAQVILEHLDAPETLGALIVRYEIELLSNLGFGLDLSCCAASGARDDLAFVSPKSGRAVGRQAGEPYADRLLRLPGFLGGERGNNDDVAAGFRLTGFFLARHVYEPRGLVAPEARAALVAALAG